MFVHMIVNKHVLYETLIQLWMINEYFDNYMIENFFRVYRKWYVII